MLDDIDVQLQKLQARQHDVLADMGMCARNGSKTQDRASEAKLIGDEIARLTWLKRYGCSANRSVRHHAAAVADSLAQQQTEEVENAEAEWYRVLETRVLVKKGMQVNATSWGFILKDQTIQVLPGRLKDNSGQEWVELTRFELWRSCLQNADLREDEKDEARGFALIDGSLLTDSKGRLKGLGAFLSGPHDSCDWPIPGDEEEQRYRRWCVVSASDHNCGEEHIETSSFKVASMHLERFEVTHPRLNVYEKPSVEARVVQQKFQGDIVAVEEERPDGWMRLAEDAGWVCFDIRRDPKSQELLLKQERQEMLASGFGRVMSHNMDVARSSTNDGRAELRRALEASECPDFQVDVLERTVNWARALGVEEEFIFKATRKIEEMRAEGAEARYTRIIRQQLADSSQTKDRQALKSLQNRIEKKLAEQPRNKKILELAEEARKRLEDLLVEEEQVKCENQSMLDKLQTAFASGDKDIIKAARDEAKAAGISKKEIARAAALAQVG